MGDFVPENWSSCSDAADDEDGYQTNDDATSEEITSWPEGTGPPLPDHPPPPRLLGPKPPREAPPPRLVGRQPPSLPPPKHLTVKSAPKVVPARRVLPQAATFAPSTALVVPKRCQPEWCPPKVVPAKFAMLVPAKVVPAKVVPAKMFHKVVAATFPRVVPSSSAMPKEPKMVPARFPTTVPPRFPKKVAKQETPIVGKFSLHPECGDGSVDGNTVDDGNVGDADSIKVENNNDNEDNDTDDVQHGNVQTDGYEGSVELEQPDIDMVNDVTRQQQQRAVSHLRGLKVQMETKVETLEYILSLNVVPGVEDVHAAQNSGSDKSSKNSASAF